MQNRMRWVITIHLDGDQWGAVVGPDPIRGVAGFGYTVNEAMVDDLGVRRQ